MVEGLELYRLEYRGNQDVGSLGQKQRFVIEEFLKTWKKKKVVDKAQEDRMQTQTFSQGDYGTQLSSFWRFLPVVA